MDARPEAYRLGEMWLAQDSLPSREGQTRLPIMEGHGDGMDILPGVEAQQQAAVDDVMQAWEAWDKQRD